MAREGRLTLHKTADVFETYSASLGLARSEKAAAALSKLAGFFRTFGKKLEMREFAQAHARSKLRLVVFQEENKDELRAADVVPYINALLRILKSASVKKGYIDDLELLIETFSNESDYLSLMLQKIHDVLFPPPGTQGDISPAVGEFIARLKSEQGTEAFMVTWKRLATSNLKVEQVVQVARAVYGGIPARTTRTAALAKIRSINDARTSARGDRAIQGDRSAG